MSTALFCTLSTRSTSALLKAAPRFSFDLACHFRLVFSALTASAFAPAYYAGTFALPLWYCWHIVKEPACPALPVALLLGTAYCMDCITSHPGYCVNCLTVYPHNTPY